MIIIYISIVRSLGFRPHNAYRRHPYPPIYGSEGFTEFVLLIIHDGEVLITKPLSDTSLSEKYTEMLLIPDCPDYHERLLNLGFIKSNGHIYHLVGLCNEYAALQIFISGRVEIMSKYSGQKFFDNLDSLEVYVKDNIDSWKVSDKEELAKRIITT